VILTQDKTKLSAAAMAVDCEGCICISRTKLKTSAGNEYYGYDCKVGIANNSMRLMRWLVRYFGGDFRPKQKGKLGKRQCFEWFCSGGHKKVEAFLLAILPYLIIKREQGILALEYVRLAPTPNPVKRAQLWQAIRDLKQREEDVESPETNTSSSSENELKIESELTGDRESGLVVTQVAEALPA
jgi:hypothetical protein